LTQFILIAKNVSEFLSEQFSEKKSGHNTYIHSMFTTRHYVCTHTHTHAHSQHTHTHTHTHRCKPIIE